MLAFEIDRHGPHKIIWPKKPADILQTAQTFLAHYATLSPSEQTPEINLPLLQTWYTTASGSSDTATLGETDRSLHAETFRQALAQLPALVDKINILLQAKNVSNLAQMEAWGFPTRQGKHGVKVTKPYGQTQLITWLAAYVAKETSLPPAERLPDPPLSQMQTLLDTLQTALTARDTGRTQREIHLANRDQALETLLNLLQLAAATLVMYKFNGKVTNALQPYGFIIHAKAPVSS